MKKERPDGLPIPSLRSLHTAVRHIAERLNSLLDQKVCSKTPEEELIKEMWDVASVDERKSLALVLLKLTEKS